MFNPRTLITFFFISDQKIFIPVPFMEYANLKTNYFINAYIYLASMVLDEFHKIIFFIRYSTIFLIILELFIEISGNYPYFVPFKELKRYFV